WTVWLPKTLPMVRGSCVFIPCHFTYPRYHQSTRPASVKWYQTYKKQNKESTREVRVLSSRPLTIGSGLNCSLRMEDVGSATVGSYHIRVETDGNAYSFMKNTVDFLLQESLKDPEIHGPEEMVEDTPVNISCHVQHTCPQSPPALSWSGPSGSVTVRHTELADGSWEASSVLTLRPSFRDHAHSLLCQVEDEASGKPSEQSFRLHVTYAPKMSQDSGCTLRHKDVTCCCMVDSNPLSVISWYLPGRNVSDE
uniref:Ig-like domain-containing protein n=1 Tax=Latimeria chalumnae TaxID=7897 RepID=H2ZT62_LATCH